ncbi:DUF3179 domain-containing protein [Candidatus Woesearchaeota archaeon]|nr:DUF3179 domain-containing protein [Candidatus Woesearchaeota archaeon]
MESKSIAAVLAIGIIAALAIGFFAGRSGSGAGEMTGNVVAADALKNQIAELKSQLEQVNVNSLYGLVKVGEKAKAYKINDLNTDPPSLANDIIGTTPVIVSWCPLCGTLTAYKRNSGGKTLTFEVAGARVIPGTDIENLHFKDKETNTIWAQGPGIAVEGPLKGKELESIPIQLFNEDRIKKMGVPVWKP